MKTKERESASNDDGPVIYTKSRASKTIGAVKSLNANASIPWAWSFVTSMNMLEPLR